MTDKVFIHIDQHKLYNKYVHNTAEIMKNLYTYITIMQLGQEL